MTPPKKYVAVNERGCRIGQDHPRAKLTNHEIELLLRLHDEEGWGYRRLAKKFEISKSQARLIVKGANRWQVAARFKVIPA